MNSALLYVRVSSKEQEKEGYSLDAQEKLGREYAQRKGFNMQKLIPKSNISFLIFLTG